MNEEINHAAAPPETSKKPEASGMIKELEELDSRKPSEVALHIVYLGLKVTEITISLIRGLI